MRMVPTCSACGIDSRAIVDDFETGVSGSALTKITPVYRHVNRHGYRHVHVYRPVYRHVHRNVYGPVYRYVPVQDSSAVT